MGERRELVLFQRQHEAPARASDPPPCVVLRGTGVSKLNPPATCTVPECWRGPCPTLGGRGALAAAGEVPMGCPNIQGDLGRQSGFHGDASARDLRTTAAAAALIARSPEGGSAGSLAQLLAAGELILLEPTAEIPFRGGGTVQATDQPKAPAVPPKPKLQESWIRIRVVDDQTSERIGGVKLLVRDTKGAESEYVTLGDGAVELNEINPGACSVRCELNDARLTDTLDFVALGNASTGGQAADDDAEAEGSGPPAQGARIAEIDGHKVHTGETIASLATAAGMTWQALATFNWGTAVPDEINKHLRKDVGCTKKTPDGANYKFDDSDEPGIIYIPKAWSQAGLATDQEHTIRVRSLGFGEPVRKLRLFDGFARAIPGAQYALEVNGTEIERGQADENGDIVLPSQEAAVVTVKWNGPEGTAPAAPPVTDSDAEPAPDDAPAEEFQYWRDIFVDLEPAGGSGAPTDEAPARKRLSNLGYSAGTLAENISAFQRDVRQAVTGVLDDIRELLLSHHDDKCCPPAGGESDAK